MGEQTRKIKPLSIVCFALAAILAVAAVFFIFFGNMPEKTEEQAEPVSVLEATGQDEYVYLDMQYMTESVAYLEAVESMQYYIAMDSEFVPAVICLYDSDLATYQPYIDWLYTDETEGGPEEIRVTGYSVPYDAELRQFVIEIYNAVFGAEILNEDNFEEIFGKCYLTVGQSSDNYENFNIGIYLLLGMVILIIIGVAVSYNSMLDKNIDGQENILEVHKVYRGRGVIGALLGALLGGVLWMVVGALGYISGWIGILIVLFANAGYKLFAKEKSGFGTVISLIFSLLVIFPATYLAGVWVFYVELNKQIPEYITLGRAFSGYAEFLTKNDGWGDVTYNMVMGYVFMVGAGLYSLGGRKKVKKAEESEISQVTNAVNTENAENNEEI